MKVNFNLTELKTIKYQPCSKCYFDESLDHKLCSFLPRTCFIDGQVFIPTENSSDIFEL